MIQEEVKNILVKTKEPFSDIIGQAPAKLSMKSALLAKRHVIIVGPPGIGKTSLAKNLASILPDAEQEDQTTKKKKTISGKKRFIRVQGSPDLTVEDLLGDIDPVKALKFGPTSTEAFSPGKLFKADNCVLFFDELNRCPEKLQNALLQVLEEGKATIGGYDIDFTANFLFIGTMNPEDSSTEKLSDVLLDRFDMVYMDYPHQLDEEKQIVSQKGVQLCKVSDKLLTLITFFVRLLRGSDKLEKKPSVRATLGLYEQAQAHALLNGREEITIEDIKAVTVSVLAHRIRLKPSSRYLVNPSSYVEEMFEKNIEQSPWEEDLKKEKGDSL